MSDQSVAVSDQDDSSGLFDADQIYHTEILPKLQEVINLCDKHGLPYHLMVCFKHTHTTDEQGDMDCQHPTDIFDDTKDERSTIQMQLASLIGDAPNEQVEMVWSMLDAATTMMKQVEQQISARFN